MNINSQDLSSYIADLAAESFPEFSDAKGAGVTGFYDVAINK